MAGAPMLPSIQEPTMQKQDRVHTRPKRLCPLHCRQWGTGGRLGGDVAPVSRRQQAGQCCELCRHTSGGTCGGCKNLDGSSEKEVGCQMLCAVAHLRPRRCTETVEWLRP